MLQSRPRKEHAKVARLIFLGTPPFGATILEGLLSAGHEVLAVVTQPDRPAGRGQRLQPSAVKQTAQRYGLEILQPTKLRRDRQTLERLRALAPEVMVLASYGQILPREVLAVAPHGCIGVHASLLPKYRGAAPIPAVLLAGEEETGITLMLTDEGMDTGPIIAQAALPILPRETAETLTNRLADLGARLLVEMLPAWLRGEITPRPQEERLATYAPPIAKDAGAIRWGRSALEIDRQIRAFTPWPGTYCRYEGALLKILSALPWPDVKQEGVPGTVVRLGGAIGVITGQGLLILEKVQPAGKRPMAAQDFARGRPEFIGAILQDGA